MTDHRDGEAGKDAESARPTVEINMPDMFLASEYASPYLLENCKETPFALAKYSYYFGIQKGREIALSTLDAGEAPIERGRE